MAVGAASSRKPRLAPPQPRCPCWLPVESRPEPPPAAYLAPASDGQRPPRPHALDLVRSGRDHDGRLGFRWWLVPLPGTSAGIAAVEVLRRQCDGVALRLRGTPPGSCCWWRVVLWCGEVLAKAVHDLLWVLATMTARTAMYLPGGVVATLPCPSDLWVKTCSALLDV